MIYQYFNINSTRIINQETLLLSGPKKGEADKRIYPTVGVSLSDKVFENIFYGVNWEFARGVSIFGGWHYGKVNTFEMPSFIAGETPVTTEQFNYFKNTRWKTSTAIGVKLDILIIKNLFGTAALQ